MVDSCWYEQQRQKQDRGCWRWQEGSQRRADGVPKSYISYRKLLILVKLHNTLRKVKWHTDIFWFFSLTALKVIRDLRLSLSSQNLIYYVDYANMARYSKKYFFWEFHNDLQMAIHFPANPSCEQYSLKSESTTFKGDHQNPGSATYYLCNFGKVILTSLGLICLTYKMRIMVITLYG